MWSVTHTSTPSSVSQRPDDDDPSKLANLLKLQASARGWLLRMRIRKSRADRRMASLLMPNINAQAAALALTAASGDVVMGYALEAAVDGQIMAIELIQGGNVVA